MRSLGKLPSVLEHLSAGMLMGLGYFTIARSMLILVAEPNEIAEIWPLGGICVWILLTASKRLHPSLALGMFFGNLSANIASGTDLWTAIAFATANTIEALLIAFLLQYFLREPFNLSRKQHVLIFFGVVVASAFIAALIGGLAAHLSFSNNFTYAVLSWWIADVASVILITPMLLSFWDSDKTWEGSLTWQKWLELSLALFLLIVVSASFAAGSSHAHHFIAHHVQPAVLVPLVLWFAFRLPLQVGLASLAAAAFIACYLLHHQFSGLHTADASPVSISFQLFFGSLASTILLVSSSIQEYLRSQKHHQEQENQFKTLVNNIPGVSYRCALDKDWTMFFISKAIEQLSGYARSDFLDGTRTYASIIHPDDCQHVEDVIVDALKAPAPYLIEYRIIHCSGEIRWVWEKGQGVFNEGGSVAWLDGAIFDITERRQMENALLQAKDSAETAMRARSQFLTNMSHEIRTPITGVLGMVELALDTELNSEQREYLGIVRSSTETLLTIVNDVLDFARLESGKYQGETHVFNLRQLLSNITAPYQILADNEHYDFFYSVDPRLPDFVQGDSRAISHVITNLLSNSRKFMMSRGLIFLKVDLINQREESVAIAFRVADSGIGIPQNRLDAILEPFTQVDASTSRQYGGSGLGLAICQELLQTMNSHLEIKSIEQVGSRFSFQVELKLARAEDAELVETSTTQAPARVTGKRLLLAEDNVVNQTLISKILTRAGYQVNVVSDGMEVLQILESESFDLILMDIQMPRMDGVEALRAIRDGGRDIPVIALTAHALPEDRARYLHFGMNDYVSKPISRSELLEKIGKLLFPCVR